MNNADFYDLFGPTKVGRKGYSALVGHRKTLIFDEPRRLELDLSGRVAGNLDRLPDYQNVPVDVDRLVTLKAALAYTDVRNSLGHVDEETGRKWSRRAAAPTSSTASRSRGCTAHSIAASACRSATRRSGCAPRRASRRATGREPFANFFFGGFGNNYVDHGDEKRYRHARQLSRAPS